MVPLIQVIIATDEDRLKWLAKSNNANIDDDNAILNALLDRGLRAQLQLESFVTGQLFVNLEFYPDTEAHYNETKAPYAEIPTIPSTLQELTQTIEDLPLRDILRRAGEVLRDLQKILSSPDIQDATTSILKAVRRADRAFAEAEKLFGNIDRNVPIVVGDLDKMTNSVEEAVATTHKAMESLDGAVGVDSEMRFELNKTLKSLGQAARSMRQLADFIERNPNAIITGE